VARAQLVGGEQSLGPEGKPGRDKPHPYNKARCQGRGKPRPLLFFIEVLTRERERENLILSFLRETMFRHALVAIIAAVTSLTMLCHEARADEDCCCPTGRWFGDCGTVPSSCCRRQCLGCGPRVEFDVTKPCEGSDPPEDATARLSYLKCVYGTSNCTPTIGCTPVPAPKYCNPQMVFWHDECPVGSSWTPDYTITGDICFF
jgi:hypothetical protein